MFALGQYSTRYDAYLRGENPTTFRMEFCNGSLVDIGIYCVAVTVGLFGKPVGILANASKLATGVDAMGSTILIYDDFEVVIMHSKVSNSSITSEIQGEQGNVYIDSISRMENVFMEVRKSGSATSGDNYR